MNRKSWGAVGSALAAFVVLIAANGKAFFDALSAAPKLFAAFAAMLPLGTASWATGTLFAGFVYHALERWTPRAWPQHDRDLLAELVALAACVIFILAQVTLAGDVQPRALLMSIVFGCVGGTAAPLFVKCIYAMTNRGSCDAASSSRD